MPFIDPIDPRDSGFRAPAPEPVVPPGTPDGGILAAAMRQENTITSLYSYMHERVGFADDPTHNPVDLIGGTKYEQNYLHRFVDSRSEADTRSRMARIDREEDDRRILDAAGFAGLAAQVGAGLLDPTLFLPAGTIYRGAKAGRAIGASAASLAAYGGAAMAIQEGILYGTQETRTGLESTLNVATGTIVAGILGGAIGAMTAREVSQLTDIVDGYRKEVNAELAPGAAPVAGGAQSAGAATNVREGLTLQSAAGLERAAKSFSPVTRLQTSEFDTAKAVVRDMADAGLAYKENLEGVATSQGGTVETRVKMARAPMIDALETMDNLHAKYYLGKQEVGFFDRQTAGMRAFWAKSLGANGGKLTAAEFRLEVGKAMRRGDEHPVPEIAAAAKEFRAKVFDPLKEQAIKLGLLPEDVDVLGATSYLTRVYNRERMKAQGDQWKDILIRHITRQRDKEFADAETRRAGRLGQLQQELRDVETPAAARPQLVATIQGELQTLRASRPDFATIETQVADTAERIKAARAAKDEKLAKSLAEQNEKLIKGAGPEFQTWAKQRDVLNRRIRNLEKSMKDSPAGAPTAAQLKAFDEQNAADLKALRQPLDDEIEALKTTLEKEIAGVREQASFDMNGIRGDRRKLIKSEEKEAVRTLREQFKRDVAMRERNFKTQLREFERKSARERRALVKEIERATGAAAEARTRADALRRAMTRERNRPASSVGELSDVEIKALVDDITNTILGESPVRIAGLSIVQGPKGPLRQRILAVPDAAIEDFLESDVEKVARLYVQSMAADIELTAKFGDVKMQEQLQKLLDEKNARYNAVPAGKEGDKARQRITAKYEADKRDIEALRDRIRGDYAIPDNPDGLMYRAGRTMLNLNYIAMLGGTVIASLPDIARPVMRYGLTTMFRDGWAPLITSMKTVKLAAREVRLAGTALEMVRDQRSMSLADLMDDYGRNSKFERGVQMISNNFSFINGMAPWTGAMKTITGVVAMAETLRAVEAVAMGRATKKQIGRLAEGGIDEAMARRVWKQAEAGSDKANGIRLPNTKDWTDAGAVEAFRAVINREVDNVIVTPGLEKPLWMSTLLGQILGQFKSFSIVSTQRIMMSGLQQRDAAVLSGVVSMMAFGALTAHLKATARGDDTEKWNEARWVAEALDNSGLLAIFGEANAMAEKVSRGRVGMAVLTGEEVSRYSSRNAMGALLGPTVGTLSNLTTIGGLGADDWSRSDTKALRRIVPLQNVFYIRGLFDAGENAVNDFFGIPERVERR